MIQKQKDGISLTVEPRDGTFTIRLPGFDLADARASARTSDRQFFATNWETRKDTPDAFSAGCRFPFGTLLLNFLFVRNPDGVPGLCLEPTLELTAAMPDPIRLAPLHVPAVTATHVVEHGRKMGGCGLHPLPVETMDYTSHFLSMVTRNEHTLQLAHPLRQHHPASFTASIRHQTLYDLRAEVELPALPAGTHALPPIRLFASTDGHALMTAYAEGERTPNAPRPTPLPLGWNSWDYYRWTVTEDEVLRNAEFIRADPVLGKKIRRIIVDDGWQYCYGEWEANPLFPGGMASLAKKITDLGFEPGLWFAPTIIEPHCRICQTEPELLAKGPFGEPLLGFSCMQRKGFLLDPTLPRVKALWRDLFRRYCDMGYRYFKLDFLGTTMVASQFADASVGRAEIMRHILEPIREATRGRAQILGCNYLFDGGDDLVDGVRTSGDIHSKWKYIQSNVRSIAGRFWMQDRLWSNDPDFAVCRGPETSDDPLNAIFRPGLVYYTPEQTEPHPGITALSDATVAEAKTLLSLVTISGGSVNLSDCLYKLNARGLDLVRKTVSFAHGQAGVPVDLFRTDMPGRWIQKSPAGWRILLINWADEPREISVEVPGDARAAVTATDLWTEKPVALREGRLTARLDPHACLLAEIPAG